MRKSLRVSLIAVFIVIFFTAYFYLTSDNQKDEKVWEQMRSQLIEDNIKEISINKSKKVIVEKDEITQVLSLIRESDFQKSNRVAHGPTPEATMNIILVDGTAVNVGFWGGTTFEFSPEHIDDESQFLVANENLGEWIDQK